MGYDLILRDARLRGREERVDVAVGDGLVREIGPALAAGAEREIDAAGGLVTESFANPHLHLDKVYTLERLGSAALEAYHGEGMGAAMSAIELAARVKEEYDASWILPNVRRALRLAARHGNTHIRAFADVDTRARLIGVEALIRAREEFRGVVEVQVVAFPQDGVVRDPGAADLVRRAMELGADVVGGIPWIEYTEADERAHVEEMMDIAVEHDADVSMLVDDAGDPGLRSLEKLAVAAIERERVGRCLAHHARAMALYPEPYFRKLVALLQRAGIGVVSDPQTGPLHARVKELLAAGARVALGQDDIADAYYPFGRNNMLEVGFLAAHLLWMTTRPELDRVYDMITVEAARAMNVADFALAVGNPAHLVVLDAGSVYEALWRHEAPRWVVSHGRVVEPDRLPGAREEER